MGTNTPFGTYVKSQTDDSGATVLVGAGGARISTLGNVLTVGSGGQYATIQAAIDYIETQSAFTALTMAAQGSVAAWTQHASSFAPDAVPTTATSQFITPTTTDKIWFKVTGDTYHYPLEEIKGVSAGVAALMGITTIRRIEASVATTKALTWYRQNDFVIYLLDSATTEDVTISANCCITFVGNGRNTWNGAITKGASFVSGRLSFSGLIVGAAQPSGMIAWVSDNTIMLDFVDCEIASVHDDFIYPTSYIGGIRVERSTISQQPTAEQGHGIAPGKVRGDIVLQDIVWRPTSHASSFVVVDNCFLVDVDTTCRNVIINGVTAFIRDKQAQFREVAIFGSVGRHQTVSGDVIITDARMVCPDALAAGQTLAIAQFSTSSTGCAIHIDNCSITAPNTSGPIKLVDAGANPAGAITVKVGRGNSNLKGDVQANITYTMVAAGVGGTATVASGATTSVVTHGLGYAPNVADIQIVPTLLSNAAKWWITSAGATTFQINVDADPGAGTATFAWRVGL